MKGDSHLSNIVRRNVTIFKNKCDESPQKARYI